MLVLGSRLLNAPIMSLQTGAKLANTLKPIINPGNLHLYAYEIVGPLLSQSPAFLLTNDVREYGHLGMIIDSNDEIVGGDEIIQLDKLVELGFPLIGMRVIDEHKHKLGKVDDYTIDTTGFMIQQFNVRRGVLKGIADTGILIHRSQIVEINDSAIIVKSTAKKLAEPVMQSMRPDFVNPFRTSEPTANTDIAN